MSWNPKVETVEEVIEMYRTNPRCTEVDLFDGGQVKVYPHGSGTKATIYYPANNAKGHISYDYYYDADGNFLYSEPHANN